MVDFPSTSTASFVVIFVIIDIVAIGGSGTGGGSGCCTIAIASKCLSIASLHQCRVYLRQDDKMHDFMTLDFVPKYLL